MQQLFEVVNLIDVDEIHLHALQLAVKVQAAFWVIGQFFFGT